MLQDKINSMVMTSMKSGEKEKAETYRLIKAKLLEAKTAKNAKPIDEAAEFTILNKMVKERLDDAANYEANGRKDLADKERLEASIISELLPKAATEDEINNAIDEFVSNNGCIDKKSMGLAIKYVKSKYATADGKLVSTLVMKRLS